VESDSLDNPPAQGVDGEGVLAWTDDYCSAHPLDEIANAAAEFYYAHPHK
jgi:hypothetical protein